jgi:hypothetical protein
MKQLSIAVWFPLPAARTKISNLISSPGSVHAAGTSNSVTSGGSSTLKHQALPFDHELVMLDFDPHERRLC